MPYKEKKKQNPSYKKFNKWKIYFFSAISMFLLTVITIVSFYFGQNQWVSYRKAEDYFAQANYEKALKFYQKSIDEHVDLWFVVDNLSKTCLALNEFSKISIIFENLIKNNPDNIYILMASGTFYINLNRYDLAISLFKRALALKPRDHKILNDLAIAYKWNQQYLLSIKTYKQLITLTKKPSVDIFSEIGDCYLLDEQYFKALKYYNMVLEKNPKSLEIRKKINLAYSWTGKEDEGLKKLEQLYKKLPNDHKLGLQISKIYIQDRKYKEAEKILLKLHQKNPNNAGIIYQMVVLETIQGHMVKAKKTWKDLIKKENNRLNLFPVYASIMTKWGDYYQAETIYRNHLKKTPFSVDVYYSLINLLIKMDRFIEAENMLLTLLSKNIRSNKTYELMAIIKFEQRDYLSSIYWINKIISNDTFNSQARVLKAKNFIQLKQFEKAEEEIKKIPPSFLLKEEGQIEVGKLYLESNQIEKAKTHFSNAIKLEPEDPILNFYLQFIIDPKEALITEYTQKKITALDLQKLADIVSETFPEKAVILYRKSLEKDSDNFQAKLGLALTLTTLKQFDESERLLFRLLEEFPNNSQLLLFIARNYRLKKDYFLANRYYQLLKNLNPKDYLIIQEQVQMAYAENKPAKAQKLYQQILMPTVDQLLFNDLKKEDLLKRIERYQDINISNNSIYYFYEQIYTKFQKGEYPFYEKENKKLENLLLNLKTRYQIQKLMYLESESKWLLFQEKHIEATKLLKELLLIYPGNQSALFDYAQAQCELGQCDKAKKIYKDILKINPSNNLAKLALKNNEIDSHTYLSAHHLFLQEEGRGDIDRMISNRTGLTVGCPLYCRHWLLFTAHRWNDKPTFAKDSKIENKNQLKGISYPAYGYVMEYLGVFSQYFKASLGFSQKYYIKKFNMKNMGYCHLWYTCNDSVDLGIGYDRENQIDNYFSLTNNIQTDSLWIKTNSLVNKRFEINAMAKYLNYTDSNSIGHLSLDLGYRLTLYPHILRLTISEEYRNTSHQNIFQYNGASLVNIVHPYWTPNKYIAFRAKLEWYHDISKYLFCGNQLHYYNLKILSGTDNEKNPTFAVEGAYHFEFKDHWTISINGLLHRSHLWNSENIKAQCKYQF